MTSTIKPIATELILSIAAVIGAVLFFTVIGALIHHPAATPAPAHTATRVVVCDTYLSPGAMRSANAANIPAAPSFCTVPQSEA